MTQAATGTARSARAGRETITVTETESHTVTDTTTATVTNTETPTVTPMPTPTVPVKAPSSLGDDPSFADILSSIVAASVIAGTILGWKDPSSETQERPHACASTRELERIRLRMTAKMKKTRSEAGAGESSTSAVEDKSPKKDSPGASAREGGGAEDTERVPVNVGTGESSKNVEGKKAAKQDPPTAREESMKNAPADAGVGEGTKQFVEEESSKEDFVHVGARGVDPEDLKHVPVDAGNGGNSGTKNNIGTVEGEGEKGKAKAMEDAIESAEEDVEDAEEIVEDSEGQQAEEGEDEKMATSSTRTHFPASARGKPATTAARGGVRPASPSPRRTRSIPQTATTAPPAAKEKKITKKAPTPKVAELKATEREVQAKKGQAKK